VAKALRTALTFSNLIHSLSLFLCKLSARLVTFASPPLPQAKNAEAKAPPPPEDAEEADATAVVIRLRTLYRKS
jgi:hypothetical protein